VEFANRSSTLHFHLVAQITGPDVGADVAGHLGPPVVTGYELEGLEAACMSGDARIMVLLNDTTPQFSVFGDIDLTAEHELPITLRPLCTLDRASALVLPKLLGCLRH
jgi:hypothetical protein